MNNEILKKVAKLGVLARKQGKTKIEFNRLMTDRAYADMLLSELEASDDEELLLLCLNLKVDFGILANPVGREPVKISAPEQTRYLHTLR